MDIFVRLATKEEKNNPGTPRSRGYNTFPNMEGYEKVYKAYGENGAGYYYTQKGGIKNGKRREDVEEEAKKAWDAE